MTDGPEPEHPQASPWQNAAADLVSARLQLLSLEAKEAGRIAAIKGALAAVTVMAMALAWLCVLAGGIGWIAAATSTPWHFVTLGAAGVHLLVVLIAVLALRRPVPPTFPLTRNELAKDREWIATLQQPRKP